MTYLVEDSADGEIFDNGEEISIPKSSRESYIRKRIKNILSVRFKEDIAIVKYFPDPTVSTVGTVFFKFTKIDE